MSEGPDGRMTEGQPRVSDIQAIILDIYKAFRTICEDHGLRYYAVGGTCLGAVRHQGFIPWDDDMDIAMPDWDYEKFLEIADRELPPHLRLFICHTHAHNTCLFDKIHNRETAFIEKREIPYPDEYKGIYMDIMPLCGLPEDPVKRRNHARRIQFLVRLNRQRRQKYSANKKFTSKALWILTRPFDFLISVDHWSKRWKRATGKYAYDESPYVGYAWSPRLNETRIYPKEMFEEWAELPFEDTVMRCPAGYDRMLTKVFGNYMKLPDEADRNTHSWGIVDIRQSYLVYAGEERHD